MLVAWLSVLVAFVGVLLFVVAKEKLSEVGRIMFFVALFIALWVTGQRTIHIP